MGLTLVQIDAFTGIPFGGNPAAICPVDSPLDETSMQKLAREMNLSETAFLWPEDGAFHLRFFTPQCEVKLCGHATLASAHLIWERQMAGPHDTLVFHTGGGQLRARRSGKFIELDLPNWKPAAATLDPALLDALGVEAQWVGFAHGKYLIEVAAPEIVEGAAPNFAALKRLSTASYILTARGDSQPYDFISRYFAPAQGVDEDPATGSAHCVLAPHWQPKIGVHRMRSYQASARGGAFKLRVEGERVFVAGRAVTVADIQLRNGLF